MPGKKKAHHYHHIKMDSAPGIQRDPRAPVGPRGPNDALMATPYRVEINTCHNTNAEKTYRNVKIADKKHRAQQDFMTNQHTLQQYADATEGQSFAREGIVCRRLCRQLTAESGRDERALLAVRQARMAELVLAETHDIETELNHRGLAIYHQRI